ncbi:MAG: glutaredoxin [Candidatus Saccharimonadales bacterium]
MSKQITVYTRTTCAYCVQVKRLLDMKNKTYSVINIDEDKEAEASIIALSGARTVPVVTVKDELGDEQVASIGWNPGALMAAVA